MKLKLPEHRTGMEQSVTYQAIAEEGAVAEARRILLALGKKRLGKPAKQLRDKIESVDSLRALELLIKRVLLADSWLALEFPRMRRD